MKTIIAFLTTVFLAILLSSEVQAQEPVFNEDDMTTYYMAFLKRGPEWTPEVTAETMKIQTAHLKNIDRLVKEGKMVLAGPFLDEWAMRGIFIYKVDSMEEAIELTEQDPAVIAGRLEMEIHPWYSAKGITVINEKKEGK